MGGVFTLAGATVVAQGLTVIAAPVLTRLYSPTEFGVLGVYVSFLAMFGIVASLRFDYAIPLPVSDRDAAEVLTLSLLTVVGVATVLAGVLWIIGPGVAAKLGAPGLAPYLWLVPVGVFAIGLNQSLSYWAIRKGEYGRLARTKISKGVGLVATQLALGFLTRGPVGLLVGDIVGRSAGGVVLGQLAWKQDRETLNTVTWSGILKQARRYRRFPLISGPASLLNSAGLHSPALLLAIFYGPHVAGLYALSQRVVGAPMVLVGTAVSQVFTGQGTLMLRNRDPAVVDLFKHSAGRLLAFGMVPVLGLAFGGPWLFSMIFGSEWLEAGQFTRVLSLMFLAQFVVVPLSQTLNMLQKQTTQFFWDLARFVLSVGSIVIPGVLRAPPVAAIASYGAVLTVSYLVLLGLAWSALNTTYPAPLRAT